MELKEKYKLIIEQEGVNHVKVFKDEGDTYNNHWNFELTGDAKPIVLSEFYTETKFVVMNSNGWIRAFDAAEKTLLFEIDLKGYMYVNAVLSIDKSKLYITFRNDSRQDCLVQLTMDTIKTETFELPDVLGKSLQIRKDGNLLFYRTDDEFLDDKKVFRHFYSVLDVTSFDVTEYELAFAPQYSFNDFIPVVDIENNRLIMPANGEVIPKTTESGETVFDYRLALFDLTTFEIVSLLSVRDIPKNQLGYYPNDGDNIAELFLGTDRDDDYIEEVREFYESLNTIKVMADGYWLCWRGGIIRRINTDFSLSPLLVTASKPNNSGEGMFNFPYFHSLLFHVDDVTIVLAEALNFYKATIPTFVHTDNQTPIALTLVSTSLEELYKMSYTTEQKTEIELRDFIQIEIVDLSTKAGTEEALLHMKIVVTDLKAAGIGSTLQFVFKDSSGKTIHEPEFFEKAIIYTPEGVHSLVETLLQHNKIKYLYRNPCETVLCHAVFELAKQDESYLTTIIKYLAAIDMDHDVFNTENIIPLLEERYTHKVLAKKTEPVSQKFSEWYECYCEEMHEE